MTSPWLLIFAGGVTTGALFGVPGVLGWVVVVGIAALPGRASVSALLIVALLGAGIGAFRVGLDTIEPLSPDVVASVGAEVVVVSVPLTGPSGPRAVVRVDRIGMEDGDWQHAHGDVLVLFRDNAPEHLAKGDRLRLQWGVSTGDGSGFAQFVRSSGASGWANAFSASVIERGNSITTPVTRLRDLVSRRLAESVPGDGGALMAGFVTGDDSGLSQPAREAFERTGMSHITAVSGSNVAVLLAIWLFLVPTGRMRRSLAAMLAILAVIWLYVLLVGLGPGAIRAGLFATFLLPAARMGRRPDPITALLLASAVMLLANPDFAHNVGYWLSLAASMAIVLCVNRRAGSHSRFLVSGAVAVLAAQLATLPIIIWIFGGWSPASVLANLIVGPIVAVVFPIAFLLAVFVTLAPWLADLIAWLPGIAANIILAIVEGIAGEASMLRLGVATPRTILLIAFLCVAIIWLLSRESRRWLARVAWRYPGFEGYATAAAIGMSIGVWLVVVVEAMS